MSALYLYDDARARAFEPFVLTRPVAELRAGAELTRARWGRAAGATATATVAAAHLDGFEEPGASPVMTGGTIPAGVILANSRCVIALGGALGRNGGEAAASWWCDGRTAAVRLTRPVAVDSLREGAVALEELAGTDGESATLEGRWLDEVWDLIGGLVPQLTEDIQALGTAAGRSPAFVEPRQAIILGEHPVYVEAGAIVEPQVCFDTNGGPIYVSRGATIRAFTRIGGPCFIGRDSQVAGDRVAASAIGENCRVHGEVSNSIFLGFANKAHDGFLGHSCLGRWVNLGAGTTTSNLKNTYGTVALWTPEGVRDTGLQFLGTLAGDHAKTGIGIRLTTGTVLGAGANVYDGMPPRIVPPFSWGAGAPYGRYRLDKFLEVAARVMERRGMTLGESGRRQLAAAYALQSEGRDG